MRLRLFGRKRRARKRAAAGGGVPAQTDLGLRPPVPVGSHRRTGQFRAPGRDWLNLGERPESSDRPGPGGGAGPDSGPAASPRLASGTRPGSGPGPGPEVQPAVGGTGSPPWGARQTWADNPARQAAGRPAAPGAGQGHLAGSLSPGHRVSGRQPRPDGLVPPQRAGGGGRAQTGNGGAVAPPGAPGPDAVRPGPNGAEHRRWGLARVAIRTAAAQADTRHAAATSATVRTASKAPAGLPWYEIAQGNRTVAGWRDCGSLESVLHREFADGAPPPEAVTAIDRLADLPRLIKDRLAAGLDAIHVGGGGVPDLDDMGRLSGVPLPSGRATWDACAGAYGERKIVVGSRPSPTPDVMCHEVGHALDDIDGPAGHWQSDSDEFSALYDQCLPHLVSNLHRQRGILGRREFFADAFAAIASRQRPALVDMLGGDTRAALNVMLYFNVRYGI